MLVALSKHASLADYCSRLKTHLAPMFVPVSKGNSLRAN